jgi:hypothetical protein
MGYAAKVLADSITSDGARLTTLEVTFPRIVLAEFNTHRMLSRNSASSRAIPVLKRIKSVVDDPFVPESFGKNQAGMQAETSVDSEAALLRAGRVVLLVAVGRCARVSYLTHDGIRDPRADVELAKRLRSSGHMSPFEHVAQAEPFEGIFEWSGNFRGWKQYRKTIPNEDNFAKVVP